MKFCRSPFEQGLRLLGFAELDFPRLAVAIRLNRSMSIRLGLFRAIDFRRRPRPRPRLPCLFEIQQLNFLLDSLLLAYHSVCKFWLLLSFYGTWTFFFSPGRCVFLNIITLFDCNCRLGGFPQRGFVFGFCWSFAEEFFVPLLFFIPQEVHFTAMESFEVYGYALFPNII